MTKLTVVAAAISAIVLAPIPAFASSDREDIEEGCRQAAMDESVATEEIVDYIAECVAANLEVSADEGGEGQEPTEGKMSE